MIPGFPVLNCVDMSKWGGELTDEEAECMASRGIRLVIVATGPGGYGERAYQQASVALRHGMMADGYAFLEFESDPVWWAEDAIHDLEGLDIRKWWVDVEDNVHGSHWTIEQRCEYVDEMFAVFDREKGKPNVGIYNAAWYHIPYFGNTTRWADRALWDAAYPYWATENNPIISLWAGREYGGFSEPEIYQFKGTTEVCGQSVDLNWARTLEGDMTEAQLLEKLEALGLIGPGIPTLKRLDQWATQTQDKNEERFAHIESLIGTTVDGPHSHRVSVTLE